MKNLFFVGSLLFFASLFCPSAAQAQVRTKALPKMQADKLLKTGDGSLIEQHLVREGYKRGKVLHNATYSGKDELGEFTITVVAVNYAAKGKRPVDQSYVELARGASKEVIHVAEDGAITYTVSGKSVQARKAGCDPIKVATSAISAGQSCSTCLNKVIDCIKAYKGQKGRIWKTAACLAKASPSCIRCVSDFIKLVGAVLECIRKE